MKFLKLAEGRGHFYKQKTMHSALNVYMQKNNALSVRFYKEKRDTLRHIYMQKTMHFALRFYI